MRTAAGEQPVEQRLAEHGGDVGTHVRLDARCLGGGQALERGGRNALHEDATQELQPRGVTRTLSDHLDRHAERAKERSEPFCARPRDERGRRQPRRRDDADERDIDELRRHGLRQLTLQFRRGGVQVGVERVGAERIGHRRGDLERDGRSVEAENDVGAHHRVLSAGRIDDPGRSLHGIEAADAAARCDEVGCDSPAGLAEAEHGDLHQPSTISRRPFRSYGELAGRIAIPQQPLSLRPFLGERKHLARPGVRHGDSAVAVQHDEVTRPNLGAADHHRARRAPPPPLWSPPGRARNATRSASRAQRARRDRAPHRR